MISPSALQFFPPVAREDVAGEPGYWPTFLRGVVSLV